MMRKIKMQRYQTTFLRLHSYFLIVLETCYTTTIFKIKEHFISDLKTKTKWSFLGFLSILKLLNGEDFLMINELFF